MASISRNILWAEDDDRSFYDCERALKEYCSRRGQAIVIHRAEDGNAVFRLMADKNLRFDVIVLDIRMPHFNGLDTIRHMSELGWSEQLVVISSYLRDPEYRKAIDDLVQNRSVIAAYHKQETDVWCERIFSMLSAEPPRILQFSDIHFGYFHAFTPRFRLENLLRPKLREVVRSYSPNVVIISGDLTSKGITDDFDKALNFVEWLSSETKVSLERFVIVPGNHDIQRTAEPGRRYDRYIEFLNRVSLDCTPFRRRFPQLYDRATHALVWDRHDSWPSKLFSLTVLDSLKLVIAGLNSVSDNEEDWERGHIEHDQLVSLGDSLRELPSRTRDYLKVAVFHHHLFPVPSAEPRWEDRILTNQGIVLKELCRSGFRLVLHGHSHYLSAYQYKPLFLHDVMNLDGLVVVSTGSLSGARRPDAQPAFNFNLLSIDWDSSGKANDFTMRSFSRSSDSLQWDDGPVIRTAF